MRGQPGYSGDRIRARPAERPRDRFGDIGDRLDLGGPLPIPLRHHPRRGTRTLRTQWLDQASALTLGIRPVRLRREAASRSAGNLWKNPDPPRRRLLSASARVMHTRTKEADGWLARTISREEIGGVQRSEERATAAA